MTVELYSRAFQQGPNFSSEVGKAEPDTRARKSSDNASSIDAPVLSMLLIGLPSTMNHLMPGGTQPSPARAF